MHDGRAICRVGWYYEHFPRLSRPPLAIKPGTGRSRPKTGTAGMLHHELTNSILSSFYEVHRELGYGFLESVYENAMFLALARRGLAAERQAAVTVFFSGDRVGHFFADLVVARAVIVEIKSCQALHPRHEAQVLNYLRATGIEVALLLHFAPKPGFRRLIFTNDRKSNLGVLARPA